MVVTGGWKIRWCCDFWLALTVFVPRQQHCRRASDNLLFKAPLRRVAKLPRRNAASVLQIGGAYAALLPSMAGALTAC